jgi:short-subunit dehydrogenase
VNAALSLIGGFLDHPIERHLEELDLNCRAPLVLAHHFAAPMRERGRGGIVLMSSLAGSQGSPNIAHYAATKAYDLVLAEGLWGELRAAGVDVLACRAGATRTPGYLAGLPPGRGAAPHEQEPEAVVREALAALGRGPSVIPGRVNRVAAFAMQRLLPRRSAVRLMGRTTRGRERS